MKLVSSIVDPSFESLPKSDQWSNKNEEKLKQFKDEVNQNGVNSISSSDPFILSQALLDYLEGFNTPAISPSMAKKLFKITKILNKKDQDVAPSNLLKIAQQTDILKLKVSFIIKLGLFYRKPKNLKFTCSTISKISLHNYLNQDLTLRKIYLTSSLEPQLH